LYAKQLLLCTSVHETVVLIFTGVHLLDSLSRPEREAA